MKKLKKILTSNKHIERLIMCFIGSFLCALPYNAFCVPKQLVTGGISGLAIWVNEIFGLSITSFITIANIILIVLSLIILGFKKTGYSIIGFGIYDLMLILTEPLAKYFMFDFDSLLFAIIFWGALSGVGFGLIYRTGFNTGGSDILIAILQKFIVVPYSVIGNVVSLIIIGLGAKTFGIASCLYAIVYVRICNFITNKLQIGESNTKICFITSTHTKEISEYLYGNQKLSYTILNSTNGIGILPRPIIFTVVPTELFYDIRKKVLSIDKHTRFIAMDSYTVYGGKTNKLLKVEC